MLETDPDEFEPRVIGLGGYVDILTAGILYIAPTVNSGQEYVVLDPRTPPIFGSVQQAIHAADPVESEWLFAEWLAQAKRAVPKPRAPSDCSHLLTPSPTSAPGEEILARMDRGDIADRVFARVLRTQRHDEWLSHKLVPAVITSLVWNGASDGVIESFHQHQGPAGHNWSGWIKRIRNTSRPWKFSTLLQLPEFARAASEIGIELGSRTNRWAPPAYEAPADGKVAILLPGQAPRRSASCGSTKFWRHPLSNGGGHVVPYSISCNDSLCGTCYPRTSHREALVVVGKLATALSAPELPERPPPSRDQISGYEPVERWREESRPVRIIVIRPVGPDPLDSIEAFTSFRRGCELAARKAGFRVGPVLIHDRVGIGAAGRHCPPGLHAEIIGIGPSVKRSTHSDSPYSTRDLPITGDLAVLLRDLRMTAVRAADSETAALALRSSCGEGDSANSRIRRGITAAVSWTEDLRVPASKDRTESILTRWCPLCKTWIERSDTVRVEWIGEGPPPSTAIEWDPASWRAVVFDFTGAFGNLGAVRVAIDWAINGERVE